MGQITISEVL